MYYHFYRAWFTSLTTLLLVLPLIISQYIEQLLNFTQTAVALILV